jgi:PAS domain S-box-containing protein
MNHVMIVEDHEENRNLLKMLLEANAYRVTAAGDGLEALAAARSDPPNVVVSDVLMPNMDGFTLCRAWMQDEALKRIPFIFYSATYVRPDDEQFGTALGAVRYLIKPVEAHVFLRELRSALQQWSGIAAPGPATPMDDATSHAMHESALARKLEDKMAQLEAVNRQLQWSEERYRRIYESLQDVYVETTLDGIILDMNPQVATLSKGQYKSEDLIGQSADALYADAQYRDTIADSIKQSGRAIDVESVFRNRDGSLIPCSVSATIVRRADGELRAIATLRDISERKKVERALLESEARFRGLIEQWFAGIFALQEQKLAYCNLQFVRVLGYTTQAELAGKDLSSFPVEKDAAAVADALRRADKEDAGPVSLVFAAVRKDGATVELELQATRATYLGRPAIIGMIQEVSEKMRAAEQP